MTRPEKQIAIDNLTAQIEELRFKIDASRLKMKFAKNISETIVIAYENLRNMMLLRMLFNQIQIIQATPNFPKGGLAIIGNDERPEIIIDRHGNRN